MIVIIIVLNMYLSSFFLKLSVKDRFYIEGPSGFLDLLKSGFWEHVKALKVVLLEYQLRHFLEETDLLEEQLNVQLLLTLHSALVILFHRFPL